MRYVVLTLGLLGAAAAAAADNARPLSPEEARKQVGRTIAVQMNFRAAKDRLEKRGEIYLDAQEHFRDPKNFAVAITRKGAAGLRDKDISDPAGHFRGRTIRATGAVK